ncbi:MAG: hypothetical protein HKN76_11945 [Saprospiraceae bacterium]|nr:hypothetical protein [Saprospiraceae bacterium]
MKFNIYNAVIAALFFVFYFHSQVMADDKTEYTKTFTKSYSLSDGGKVNIENMHGQVHIKTWDRNEVNIVVTVRVDAKNQGDADDVFDRITIDFSGDNRYVSAKTTIDSKRSSWWFIKSWWDDDDVQVDYEVSMPTAARLDLSHKYGNADLEDFSSDVEVNLKYGDLKIDEVAGDLKLDLSYGNATVAKANNTTADIAYFKLRVNEANKVEISSKYSHIYIESANDLISYSGYDGYHLGDIGRMTNEGKYDNIEVDKIEYLDVITKYTKINLEHLVKRFSGQMSYGGLEIDRLDNSFEAVEIESRYTGSDINVDDVSSFRLNVEGKYFSFKEPDSFSTNRSQKEDNYIRIEGYRGSKNAAGMIRVQGEYGGLKVR